MIPVDVIAVLVTVVMHLFPPLLRMTAHLGTKPTPDWAIELNLFGQCCEMLTVQFGFGVRVTRAEWTEMNWLNKKKKKTCDTSSCVRISNWMTKRDPHPPPPPLPPHHIPLNQPVFKNQECSLSLFPDGILCNQSQFVLVKLPLSNLLYTYPDSALLCHTSLVRYRVWVKRRGPTYSPCSATLSGWRLWGGTPSTKSLSSKTSIRSVEHHTSHTLEIHRASSCCMLGTIFFCFLSGLWIHVQSGSPGREDGPSPWVVQCL